MSLQRYVRQLKPIQENKIDYLDTSPLYGKSEKKIGNFQSKFKIPYKLLCDIEKKVINSYGVWGEKKFMGREYMGIIRTTFIVDESGVIIDIIEKVKTKDHTNQIIE